MRIQVTIPDELHEWLTKKVEKRDYYNLSHAVEVGLLKLKEEEI